MVPVFGHMLQCIVLLINSSSSIEVHNSLNVQFQGGEAWQNVLHIVFSAACVKEICWGACNCVLMLSKT